MACLVEQHQRAETALAASERKLREARDELETKVAERTAELQRSAQELQRSEFYLAEGQRLGHTGSWALNPSGFFEYWSRELFQIYGLDPQKGAPTLEQYLATIHPQDRDFMAETIKRMCEQSSGCDAKKRIIRPDGAVRYIRCVGIPVLDNGVLKRFLGTAMDVTEQEQLTQELQRREAYLAEAQRLSQTGSWAWSPDQDITYWSEECYRVLSFDPQDGLPRFEEFFQRIHPDDQPGFRELIQTAIREKAEWEADYRIVHPDGPVRDIHVVGHPVLSTSGHLVEFVGTVIDVTERRRAEQRLLVQYRVTRILAEAATVEEATPKILQAVCECIGWHVGVLWRIDREAGVLRCAGMWRKPSVEAAQFEALTRTSTFSPGSGLPGRVWASGAPAYIRDVIHDPNFPRANIAAREGMRGDFAFPIRLGREVLGVIEFFSRDLWQRDDDLLDMMATLGSQIGQFTKRAATVNELHLRVNMLQQIPVAAWSVTPDGTPDIVNQLWYEYTGQTPEYVNSHPEAWMATLHPEDREGASRIYWDGIRSGRGFTMEARFLRARDGTYRWHLNRAVPVRDPEGNILRLVGTSTDVHDLRQARKPCATRRPSLRT